MLARVTMAALFLAVATFTLAGEPFPGYRYTEYGLSANNSVAGIVAGSDGNMWFTEPEQAAIGRITLDGTVRSFSVDDSRSRPDLITLGPDGNLWFTDQGRGAIGRMTPRGEATALPLLTTFETAVDIVTGPDGNLWFTEQGLARGRLDGRVGRITPNGTVSLLPLQRPAFFLTNGPDGALWFTSLESIGRITTGGQDRFFDVGGGPRTITTGPDGALWFTSACTVALQGSAPPEDECNWGIGRLTTDGVLTKFPDVEPGSGPLSIVRGPEDNLWFTREDGRVSRINEAGTVDDVVFLSDDFGLDIAPGPDGALWFTQAAKTRIGRVNSLAYNFINIANGAPEGLAEGPDGSLWFADAGGNRVGRFGRNSLIQYELGGGHSPYAIAPDPDGGAWFANIEASTIGRITAEGEFVEFAIPAPNATPQDIVRGPDGNFWFTLATGRIGRITPQGVITTFPAPSPAANPQGIAVGADGNLWFTESAANKIARMTTDGEAVDFPIPTAATRPWDIAAGGDGALYFTELRGGRVGRITTAGAITELGPASPSSSPRYIARGPDGAMWFTIVASDNTRLGLAAAPPAAPVAEDPTPTPTPGKSGLGRIARDGRITKFDLPVDEENPAGIAGIAPDPEFLGGTGILFVALFDNAQIAAIELFASEPTRTATPTTANTPIATATHTLGTIEATRTATATASTPVATATHTGSAACVGDCNGDGRVLIGELISAVNIALNRAAVSTCRAVDVNGDGMVLVNELIAAVTRALRGCAM